MAPQDWSLVLVATITALVGLTAIVWALQNDVLLVYADASAHLNAARRVLDSRTPGLVQLSTLWLPVPHVLMLPFVQIDILWYTGLAGSIVGLASSVVTAVALFLAVRLVARHRAAPWLAVAVFLSNPNALYLQTTPLTEPVLMAAMTASTYYLIRWSQRAATPDAVRAGALAAVAVGTGYEGWLFAWLSVTLVVLIAYLRSHDPREAEGNAFAYLMLPAYGMLLWIVFNVLIFGDPLEFLRGGLAVAAQQAQEARVGFVLAKENLGLSALTYYWATLGNLGGLILASAVVGAIAYLVATGLRADRLVPYVLLAPFPFYVAALWLGQVVIVVPQSDPSGYFNVRHGVLMLPAAAFFIAYGADLLLRWLPQWLVLPAVTLALAAQVVAWVLGGPASSIVLTDGLTGLGALTRPHPAAQYLRQNYNGGGILMDEIADPHLVTGARISMREYIGPLSGAWWDSALGNPAQNVRWVVTRSRGDAGRVRTALRDNAEFTSLYRLEFDDQGIALYRRTTG